MGDEVVGDELGEDVGTLVVGEVVGTLVVGGSWRGSWRWTIRVKNNTMGNSLILVIVSIQIYHLTTTPT